jgi:hypothetical protein
MLTCIPTQDFDLKLGDSSEGHGQSSECSIVFLVLWGLLDLCVLIEIIIEEDTNAAPYEYLTNQVWISVFVVKIFFVVALFRHKTGYEDKAQIRKLWYIVASFLAAGAAQAGIMMTFFVLAYQDCTLLSGMVQQGVAISDVMIWNHLRHVTVCFLHLLVYIGERRFITRITYDNSRKDYSVNSLFAYVVLTPLTLGFVHSIFFDDQRIYRYQDKMVGLHCMFAFGLAVIVAGSYYVYGPIRTTYRDAELPFALGRAIEMDLILDIKGTATVLGDMRKT